MEKYTVYILPDTQAEELYNAEDIDGFREMMESSDMWLDISTEEFDTEAEKTAFLKGLAYNRSEEAPGMLVLCSDNECDIPYIDTLKAI